MLFEHEFSYSGVEYVAGDMVLSGDQFLYFVEIYIIQEDEEIQLG